MQELAPERGAGRVRALPHQVRHALDLPRQRLQHIAGMGIAELDVFVDRRGERQDARDDGRIHLERRGTERHQRVQRAGARRFAAQHARLGEVGGMDHRLHQRHHAIVLLGRGLHTLGLERGEQRRHPRSPCIQARFADHHHPALQGRRLGRGGHRMQAHHLGARRQHRRHRCGLDRGDVQPQTPGFATGGKLRIAGDQRPGAADRRRKNQDVRPLHELGFVGRCRIGRIVANDLQAHPFLEEVLQPAAIGACAADDADQGSGHEKGSTREPHSRSKTPRRIRTSCGPRTP